MARKRRRRNQASQNKKQKRTNGTVAAPINNNKGDEAQYQRNLNVLGRELLKAVQQEVLPFLKANQESYVMDGLSDDLRAIFEQLNRRFSGVVTAGFAQTVAGNMVNEIDEQNQQRFRSSVRGATGIDPSAIMQEEGLQDFVTASINRNVQLIKSLPEEYFKEIETIVYNGITSGARYSTIAKEITAKVGSANSKLKNRIKTIARNEVTKINSQMAVRRSEELGITEGIYRTVQDERVRPCHAELEGVRYELKKGAWSKTCQKWIIPGVTDVNCRCSYSPVIEV